MCKFEMTGERAHGVAATASYVRCTSHQTEGPWHRSQPHLNGALAWPSILGSVQLLKPWVPRLARSITDCSAWLDLLGQLRGCVASAPAKALLHLEG